MSTLHLGLSALSDWVDAVAPTPSPSPANSVLLSTPVGRSSSGPSTPPLTIINNPPAAPVATSPWTVVASIAAAAAALVALGLGIFNRMTAEKAVNVAKASAKAAGESAKAATDSVSVNEKSAEAANISAGAAQDSADSSKVSSAAARQAAAASERSAIATETGTAQLQVWRQREETYRTLRWAADHAMKDDQRAALIGVTAMKALQRSLLLQPNDVDFVRAVMRAVVDLPPAKVPPTT